MAVSNPFQTHAQTVLRQSDNGIWRASFGGIDDDKFWTQSSGRIYFGPNNSAAPKRLKEILDILDARGLKWQWPKGLTDQGDFIINWAVSKENELGFNKIIIKSAELTVEAYQAAMRSLKTDTGTGLVSAKEDMKKKYTSELAKYNLQWEHLPGNRDWLVWGIASVTDGDTIGVTIHGSGSALQNLPAFKVEGGVKKTVKIRFAGIDTPETKKDNTKFDDAGRNAKIAKTYQIPIETVYDIGIEAKKATTAMVHLAGSFVIVDIDVLNNAPKTDKYGRYVGMVYKSLYNPSIAVDPMDTTDWYININKTLVASASTHAGQDDKGNYGIPLAQTSGSYQYDLNNTKFDVVLWQNTVALHADNTNQKLKEEIQQAEEQTRKQVQAEIDRMRDSNGKTTREVKTYIVQGGETIEGIIKEFRSQGTDLSVDVLVSINDIQRDPDSGAYILPVGKELHIPIIKKIDNSTPTTFNQTFGGILDNTTDFFTAIDDRREMTTPYHVRIGDVQFVVPPLSIGSNQTSSIEKVKTLRTRASMMTKAGSTHRTVTLQLYFHDLETINGYRVHLNNGIEDYYMDGLRPLIAQFKKAPFVPIINEYINETLGIHEVILVNLSVSTVPGFPHSLAATLTLAEFDPETYMPHIEFLDTQINYPMFRWFYQQPMMSENASNPYRSYLAPIQGRLTNDFHFKVAREEDLIARLDAGKSLRFLDAPIIFDDKVTQGKNLLGRLKRDGDKASLMLDQYKKYKELYLQGRMPQRFGNKDAIYALIYGTDFKLGSTENAFFPKQWSSNLSETNHFYIRLEAETNINDAPSQFIDKIWHAGAYKLSEAEIPMLEKIAERGRNAQTGVDLYHSNYKKLSDKANGTESTLDMDDFYIDNLLITAMNVTYENSFSQVQTQTGGHPTYQYLGSQDPYITLTMETNDRSAIMSLQHIIKTADEYSLKYRYGITSGFIGFENQLSKLFGVTTIMVENCQINTMPGFPNRFQIQMTLCGFDKTQKRTESLQGFSAADQTTKYDRNVVRDPSNADAIIVERKMKDLEVYPDLELPTYNELNKVLPSIGAGIDIYHNASGAKYVDPDFYVATNWTFRSYFKQFKDHDNKDEKLGLMDLQDFSGMMAKTHVASDRFFDMDAESLKNMDSIDAAAREYMIADPTSVPGMIESMPLQGPSIDGTPLADAPKSDLNGWHLDRGNIYKKPDSNLVLKWMGYNKEALANDASAAYAQIDKFLSNPTPLEVYQQVYYLVDKYFVANGSVFDDRKDSSDKIKNITYATVEDLARASYMWLKYSGDSRFANAPAEDDGNQLKYSDLNATGGRITRERIANYLKSKYQQESSWEQFKGGVPLLPGDGKSTSVGIGQMTISIHARSIEDAQRLSWDWRYCMERSVQYYIEQWDRAMGSTDIQVRSRPWDWAILWFNLPSAKSLSATPYWNKMVSIFQGGSSGSQEQRPGAWYNAPASRYNTPGVPENQDIFNYLNNTNTQVKNLIMDDIDAMKKALIDLPPSNRFAVQVGGAFTFGKNSTNATKEEIDAAFKNLTGEDIKGRYVQAMEYQTLRGAQGPSSKKALGDYKVYKHYQDVKKTLQANLLINNDNPNALFRDMWTDVVEHDHRGRLLRAFPTFQMFIVEEGRWMANYKLWDNLYGFNAIQSIDVHKSRKIAADTAVIRMTNMYSNLTSRKMDESYGDWQYSFWDNLFWGEPTEQLLKARKELVSSMMLQTGARIHLRVGYGSDATSLPVMFNGTITELNTDDIVEIVAQGDGIELSNMISADPNETNDAGLFAKLVEPRDLLCRLLTSKGNWFRDVINNESEGKLFKDHPLGIQHFGNPVKTPEANAEIKAIFGWYSEGADFGEAVQNIYSSNGKYSFGQNRYPNGEEIESAHPAGVTSLGGWDSILNFRWTSDNGDEADVEMKLYGRTVWDVAQTLAYVSPDYIAAVLPFEMRSTLFFGKPYYKVAYRYDSVYGWDDKAKLWKRTVTSEYRKPFQQFHYFASDSDILSNRIKASEEGMFTNVIAMVEGKPTMMQMADEDIRFDKQKTKVVDTGLVGGFAPFQKWTSDKQGEFYAQSALRDYIKDMYKGTLTVMGDPTVKPHDMCYLADTLHDMNGAFLVKDVTHSFSMETGFITMISPDAVVVVDDAGTIGQATWLNSAGISFTAYLLGKKTAARGLRAILGSSTMLGKAGLWTTNTLGKSMVRLAAAMPHDKDDIDYKRFKSHLTGYTNAATDAERQVYLNRMETTIGKIEGKLSGLNLDTKIKKLGNLNRKGLLSLSKGIVKNLKNGKNALAFFRVAGIGAGAVSGGITVLATMALTIMTEGLVELFRRNLKARQAVMIVPLRHQGRNFTAGLNGVAGAVVGTAPGKMDQFWMGTGYGGKNDWTKKVFDLMSFIVPGDITMDYDINSADPSKLGEVDNAYNDRVKE